MNYYNLLNDLRVWVEFQQLRISVRPEAQDSRGYKIIKERIMQRNEITRKFLAETCCVKIENSSLFYCAYDEF